MINRRTLVLSVVSAAFLAGCASAPLPEGEYGLLKQFKAQVNLTVARMDLAFKDMDSIHQIYVRDPQGKKMFEKAYDDLAEQHNKLKKRVKDVEKVRATINDPAIAEAFDNYVTALKGLTDIDIGEIDQDRINAAIQTAGKLEKVMP